MNEDAKQDKTREARITDKFDRVLKRHIRRLLEGGDPDSIPPHNLNMITCLLILAEREKEIGYSPNSLLKRYNQETLLKDLDEIGIDVNEGILVEIQDLSKTGYIYVGDDDEYRAREPATKFLATLDIIFPTMPGLSLIAYILQAVDEVMDGRKEMMNAIRQFDETLLTRGESVSKQRIEAMRRQRAAATMKKHDPAAQKLRGAYLEKLKALRSEGKDKSTESAVVITSGYASRVEIRELFPREPEPTVTPPPPPVEQPQPAPAQRNESAVVAPASAPSVELPPPAMEQPVPPPTASPPEPVVAPKPVSEPIPEPTPEQVPEPVSAAPEKTAPAPDISPPAPAEPKAPEAVSIEDSVAQKIKAFEEQLAMACPVCEQGKILKDVTEKEKTYYYCSNDACGLVSWGKPHHTPCPVCKNPFLVEFEQMDGGIGLKCPRATCAFEHRNLDGKSLPGTVGGESVRKVAVRKKVGSQGGVRRKVVRIKK